MKNIYLLLCLVLFWSTVFSQNEYSTTSTIGSKTFLDDALPSFQDNNKTPKGILWEQQVNTTGSAIWSVVTNYFDGAGYGIYAADDFELTEEAGIATISVGGTQMTGNFEDYLLGFDLFIYNDVSGLPDGNPSVLGSGILELTNIDPLGDALTIEPNGSDYTVTVDITTAMGTEINLPAGTYWLVAFPRMDLTENDGLLRWTWYDAEDPDLLTNAKMIDPSGATGLGIENWTDISIVGLPMDNLAFTIEDKQGTTIIDEFVSNPIVVYPNPAKDFIFINTPVETIILNAYIFNASGQKIKGQLINDQINISGLAKGIYTLRLESKTHVYNERFIKR